MNSEKAPDITRKQSVAASSAGIAQALRGSETILVVDDEEVIRTIVRAILESSGYVVHEARNGWEGLKFCKTHQSSIDLLLSDVVMPELGGRELAETALKLRPGLKVMLMSGHPPAVVFKGSPQNGYAFLQKPFTPVGLTQKVRETLGSSFDSAAGA